MQVMTQVQLNQMTGMAKVINVAGRQRMLSQKLTKELLKLRLNNQFEEYDIDMIDNVIYEFEGAHYSLLLGNKLRGIPEKNNKEILQKYQEINDNENRPYIISVSHGIVEHDKTQDSEIDTLIKIADNRMYEEKRYIKNDLKIKVIR